MCNIPDDTGDNNVLAGCLNGLYAHVLRLFARLVRRKQPEQRGPKVPYARAPEWYPYQHKIYRDYLAGRRLTCNPPYRRRKPFIIKGVPPGGGHVPTCIITDEHPMDNPELRAFREPSLPVPERVVPVDGDGDDSPAPPG